MSGHWNKSKLFGLDEQLGQQLSLVGVAEWTHCTFDFGYLLIAYLFKSKHCSLLSRKTKINNLLHTSMKHNSLPCYLKCRIFLQTFCLIPLNKFTRYEADLAWRSKTIKNDHNICDGLIYRAICLVNKFRNANFDKSNSSELAAFSLVPVIIIFTRKRIKLSIWCNCWKIRRK